MTYIDNIFVCISAPVLIAALCAGRKYYAYFFFILAGMASCMLSAYINTFFTELYDADLVSAKAQIAPMVEEIMKLLPLLFYLLVFEPRPEKIKTFLLILAAGFATFENICFLTNNGAAQLPFLLIRGFGTGAMHIVCGAIAGYGLVYVWPRGWLRIAGTWGLLCAAVTFHAIYNLLIAYGGLVQYIAYALPIIAIAAGIVVSRHLKRKA